MGLKDFKSQTVFLDTAPLIYFIEGHTVFQSPLERFFSAFEGGDFSILTSTLTILEVLVKPLQMDRVDLVRQYKKILSSASGIEIMDRTLAVACRGTEIKVQLENSGLHSSWNCIRIWSPVFPDKRPQT